jgi:hypothetical protein
MTGANWRILLLEVEDEIARLLVLAEFIRKRIALSDGNQATTQSSGDNRGSAAP